MRISALFPAMIYAVKMVEESLDAVVDSLIEILKEISVFPESRNPEWKEFCNLARRVRILSPLFEELRDVEGCLEIRSLLSLKAALESARDLLQFVKDGSKLYQVMQREKIENIYHKVTEKLEKALDDISYDKLDISEEVKEQVELVHTQFKRAKGRMKTPDLQLFMDLSLAQKEKETDPAILKRLSEKLQLRTINDIKKESLALHEMVISSGGDPEERLEEMSIFLKKLKDYVLADNPDMDLTVDVELPKREGSCKTKKPHSFVSDSDQTAIKDLLQKLSNGIPDEQRAAAGDVRLLTKRNADSRVYLAEAGAISLLVKLLSSSDHRTQEHAVTALLNLSINETNKGGIVNAGAIPKIVEVLKNGNMEARENAATTLFSLSIIDENKVVIGAAGAMPALIDLLCQGSPTGKKDAATAIFNLSIYQGNKVRALRAGIVVPLMKLSMDRDGGLVDEALAILAILASHPEGKVAIGKAGPIPVLVEVLQTGLPQSKENAAAVLCSLCTANPQHLIDAMEVGAEEALKELANSGSDRAKKKARSVLDLISRSFEMADDHRDVEQVLSAQ